MATAVILFSTSFVSVAKVPRKRRKSSAAITPKDPNKETTPEFLDSRSKSTVGRRRKIAAVENVSSDDEIKFETIKNDRYSGIYERGENAHDLAISPVKQDRVSTGKTSRGGSKVRDGARSGGRGSSMKAKPVVTDLDEDLDDWADSLAASQSQKNEPTSAFKSARLSGKRKLGYILCLLV